ncbi:DNA mismatch repair protein MutS [Rubellimicrobium rubrum]|uniref:DNA mismatch repair protein MutS n=1 Tax=Rubellimicrobium rubrum TaxID=2585369 RepID=A0A5C4MT88_9RHOB|nr:Smr/MutS family protein [Rubellimicrobium rubrum]TNC48171.1 DNA mismatch repair protein MutS [Rubellimicrobium rubrum]
MSRRLSPEDRELWDRVKGSAVPLHGPQPIPSPSPRVPDPVSAPSPVPASPKVGPFRLGQKVDHRRSNDLLPGLVEGLGRMPLRMDAGQYGRMTKGKLRPEGRIDLHGMTVAEAHPALASFILGSRASGRRLVLVITGKGRVSDEFAPMPARAGRLRHDVPRWLALAPLSAAVLQVAPAHRRHGGEGALYVYLRAP